MNYIHKNFIAFLLMLHPLFLFGAAELPLRQLQSCNETFIDAAYNGDLQAVQAMLLYQINPNATVGEAKVTALRQASQNGHTAVA